MPTMIRRPLWIAHVAAIWLLPATAGAVSLVVDRLGTPDVVQVGDMVSFSFAFQFEPDEVLLSTQAELSAPHLSDFQFASNSGISRGNPWDLSSTFRRVNLDAEGTPGNPMWVHAENVFGEDAMGVTWEEVGGLAPVGSFSAVASYNGEIVFDLSTWSLSLLLGFNTEPGRFGTLEQNIALDPAWAHIRTGVTIVGGLELPPPPPPPVAAPVEPPPVVQPPSPVAAPPSNPDPPPQIVTGPTLGDLGNYVPGDISVMPTAIAFCDASRRGCIRSDRISRPGIFYPAAEDSDPRFYAPAVHVGGVGGAVPEPSTSVLVLLVPGFLAFMRRR